MNKRTVRHYAEEFKINSAKLASDSDKPLSRISEELGVHSTTLRGWIDKYISSKKSKSSLNHSLEEENTKLKKENKRLKQEREILKKAAAYFASEVQ